MTLKFEPKRPRCDRCRRTGTEPELAVFNGRVHDRAVKAFRLLDRELLDVAVERVCRAHGERAIETANQHREQWLLLRHRTT